MISKSYTLKKLFDEICDLEVKYKLFEKQIDGIYFWKLIRSELFYELVQAKNLYGDSHPGLHMASLQKNKRKTHFQRIRDRFFSGALRDKKKYDILLFPHPRKRPLNNTLVDIYTYNKELQWKKEGINFAVIEGVYEGKRVRDVARNIYWNDFGRVKIMNKLFVKKNNQEIRIENFMPGTKKIADIKISTIKSISSDIINKRIYLFKIRYQYYKKVIKYHKPKLIYMVIANDFAELIAAARDLNVETVEIQHGTISQYHISYSYPKEEIIPYFPDKLEMWGKYWFDNSNIPIKESNISYVGYSYLINEMKKYSKAIRDNKRILFISQGAIAKGLIPYAIKLAKLHKDLTIIYRLHPSEVSVWQKIYPNLSKVVSENKNILIELPNEISLYESFSLSKFVIGVYSTSLIEALVADNKIILVNLPGVEYFQTFIENKVFILVSNEMELSKAIFSKDEKIMIDLNYFFENSN